MKKEGVHWYRLVWFPQAIPRHSFITWLAAQDRLSTGVPMRNWAITQVCVFCGERNETKDHLFFACPYPFTVWTALVATPLGTNITPDWTDTVPVLLRASPIKLDSILLRLAFQVAVYLIWKEIILRRHQGVCRGIKSMICSIDKTIRNRVVSLHYHGDHKLEGLLHRWFEVFFWMMFSFSSWFQAAISTLPLIA